LRFFSVIVCVNRCLPVLRNALWLFVAIVWSIFACHCSVEWRVVHMA